MKRLGKGRPIPGKGQHRKKKHLHLASSGKKRRKTRFLLIRKKGMTPRGRVGRDYCEMTLKGLRLVTFGGGREFSDLATDLRPPESFPAAEAGLPRKDETLRPETETAVLA